MQAFCCILNRMKLFLFLIFSISVHADNGVVVFEQRDIPDGVLLSGHAEGSKKYGYRIPSLCISKKERSSHSQKEDSACTTTRKTTSS